MLELLIQFFVSLDEDKTINLAPRCLSAGFTKYEIIAALNDALKEIGNMYSKGAYTLSDLMMAGIMYEEIINIPEFDIRGDIEKSITIGTIVLGTIEGDIHDLGKFIFKSAAEAAGFNVIDIGVDVSPDEFVESIKKHKPDILAISTILTTTVPNIQKTIKLLEDDNIRNRVKILIGGSIMGSQICTLIGADAYTGSALKGIEICKAWLENNDRNNYISRNCGEYKTQNLFKYL